MRNTNPRAHIRSAASVADSGALLCAYHRLCTDTHRLCVYSVSSRSHRRDAAVCSCRSATLAAFNTTDCSTLPTALAPEVSASAGPAVDNTEPGPLGNAEGGAGAGLLVHPTQDWHAAGQ